MHLTWNEAKNKLNKEKHAISFELAKKAFEDPYLLSWVDERFSGYGEERWLSLGCIDHLVVITIVHTFRSNENAQEIIHIISARKATNQERKTYFNYRGYVKK
jgi:uncharacterized protein